MGETKDGWPVYVECVGKLDPEGLVKKLDEATRAAYQIFKLEDNEAKCVCPYKNTNFELEEEKKKRPMEILRLLASQLSWY